MASGMPGLDDEAPHRAGSPGDCDPHVLSFVRARPARTPHQDGPGGHPIRDGASTRYRIGMSAAVPSKTDLAKHVGTYAARRGRFDVVDVPPLWFLMIDGAGDPNTSTEYRAALETLYPVAYRLKFLSKRELGRDYTVMPLEALWWADDLEAFTARRDKSQWKWTAMILTPDWIAPGQVDEARDAVAGRAPRASELRFERFDEGLCVQTLHVGPYDDEAPVLARMHDEVIPAEGLRMTGRHHEIYLSDARRTAPEKLRTILRQPVERVGSGG
jgi:hypothetical protein